jgi:tRNA 2-thiouridine synthesizing protein A
VVLTKKALASLTAGQLEVLVDNPAARDNVLRFARNTGCRVELGAAGDDYLIRITKG